MGRSPRRGLLIALEGIDGSGKSTLQRRLARAWRASGWSVDVRSEPTDPALGRLAQELGSRDPWASAMLFTLDRLLGRASLERALSEHDIVLSDRSYFSTLAYQGSAMSPAQRRRLPRLQRAATVRPDRVLLLAIPPPDALRRVRVRGRPRAPLERGVTLARVDRAYRQLARAPGWVTVDARSSPSDVGRLAHEALDPWLRRRLRSPRPTR